MPAVQYTVVNIKLYHISVLAIIISITQSSGVMYRRTETVYMIPDTVYSNQSCCPRGLALASRILEDTSWRSWPWPWEKSLGLTKATTFPCPVVAVCSAYTHGVTRQSAISCSGMFHRLACELDVGSKKIRVFWSAGCLMSVHIVHSAYSSCSRCYNYMYSLCFCLELTNSVSVGLLCSQLPLRLLDLHSTHSVIRVCYSSCDLCLVT